MQYSSIFLSGAVCQVSYQMQYIKRASEVFRGHCLEGMLLKYFVTQHNFKQKLSLFRSSTVHCKVVFIACNQKAVKDIFSAFL